MSNRTPTVPVEQWKAEAQRHGGKILPVQRFVGDVAGAAEADGLIPTVMSRGTEDRGGDEVAEDGWELADYLKNPVLLWSHDHGIPAIGNMVDLATGPLRGKMKFTPREVNAFGDMIGGLYRHGFLKAGSVGFMPIEWSFGDNGGVRFKRQALLEHSCCNVPMHPDALTSAKSLGVEVDLFLPFAERVLDGDASAPAWMQPKQAITVYRSLGARPVQVPAAFDPAPLLAELKRIGSAVEEHGRALASLKAAPVVAPPAPAPTSKAASPFAGISPESLAKVVGDLTRRELASITGRVAE